jgi:hypothetical protein
MPTKPQKLLETFPNPEPEREYEIHFTCPEFTCVCPRTGQPDFATIRITYVPDKTCVELKSLKLYLWSYRETSWRRPGLAGWRSRAISTSAAGSTPSSRPGTPGGSDASRPRAGRDESRAARFATGGRPLASARAGVIFSPSFAVGAEDRSRSDARR